MGKRGGKRAGRGRGGGGQRQQRTDYQEVPKSNALFEKYYNQVGVVDDAEREGFWSALRRELPNSFRFAGSKGHAIPVRQRLKDHYIPEITAIEHNGELVEPPTVIPWVPDQMAWRMTTPKNVVRRFPPFASFQKFLVSETNVGNISRQEAVSMIPPLLMDVAPGMTVLDLCAAPGSKAAQLIEMVHGGEEARMRRVWAQLKRQQGHELSPNEEATEGEMEEDEAMIAAWEDDGRTTGLLIANDADYKRAHMLIHQMKRLNSPNLIVTNHDATIFPSIKLKSEPGPNGGTPRGRYLKFDRILADVPCSGDGTCRKNINVWKDWNPGNAVGLFITQVRILVRGLQMLKVGGRIVYSTCSMNPIENEAVVAAAVARCGGSSYVDVVDCKEALPDLKRRPGLSKWNVIDKQGNIWQSWSEVEEERLRKGSDGLGRLAEEMFPPNDPERLPFERCMRVYPHLQDTGGFFIAVLEKKSEIKARPEGESKKLEPKTTSSILDTIAAIEAMPANGTNPIEKIDVLDSIMPTSSDNIVANPSAAARQNRENAISGEITAQKRERDAETDAGMATKRPKIREEVDEPAIQGTEDREVHWPPPPAAQLNITLPVTADSHPNPIATTSKNPLPKSKPTFEEPFKYLSPDHPELQSIYEFYDLSPRFPRDRFMVRNASGNPVRTIYYTSTLARDILIENEGKGIKFVHCGVKMFVSQDVQKVGVCPWRIQSEGLPILEGWVGEDRVVRLRSRETLRKLLVEMFPKVTGEGSQELGEIGERVRDISMGCCVLRVEKSEEEDGFRERIVLPLWRSLHSLNLMLAKDDRKAMLLRLFNDDTPLKDRSKDRFAAPAQGDASTSTLSGTTAERAKADRKADALAEAEEVPADGEGEDGVDGDAGAEMGEGEGDDDEDGVGLDVGEGEGDDDEDGVGLNVGGGAGIMSIGGAD